MEQKEKWQKDLEVYRDVSTTFIVEGNVYDRQPWFSELEQRIIPIPLSEYLHRYLEMLNYEEIVFYNIVDGFYNPYKPGMVESFFVSAGLSDKDIRKISRGEDTDQASDRKKPAMPVCEAVDLIRFSLQRMDCPKAVILEHARGLTMEPDHMSESEVENYTKLILASLSPTVSQDRGGKNLKNLCFFLVEKANDVPAWFYLENPLVKILTISKPGKTTREAVVRSRIRVVRGAKELPADELDKIIRDFALLTEGMSLVNLDGIITIMRQRDMHISAYREALKLFRYGETESHWDKIDGKQIKQLKKILSERVRGQEEAVSKASGILGRACLGLSGLQGGSESRPKGVLFFAGPTGTGKTELAKKISEFVFGDESFITRFDMSEYGQAHSDQKLLGAPPGYVGYSAGGQLTNAVKEKPFCILLFDEIEKAHPTILDKFLQILEDGRLTDSSGETVYFSEAMIIFTSNLGITKDGINGEKEAVVTSDMPYEEMKQRILSEIHNYFKYQINRPEILNRIGENIVVFDYIRPDVAVDIMSMKLEGIKKRFKETKGIDLILGQGFMNHLSDKALSNLENGGRGVVNVLESDLVNSLAGILMENPDGTARELYLEDWDEDKGGPIYSFR